MKKIFVLDTNVLLHDSRAPLQFDDNIVIIPLTVVEELDHFKKEMNDLGRSARAFSRWIDTMRAKGSLVTGVPLNDRGGILKIGQCNSSTLDRMPVEMDRKLPDNKILAAALHEISRGNNDSKVILISNDTNLRIKADILGIYAETYELNSIPLDELYTGVKQLTEGVSVFDLPIDTFKPNEFIIEADGTIYRFDADEGMVVLVATEERLTDLSAKNDEQRMALEILLDDRIKLVTLVGKAGTGKTLLAVAAGLKKVMDEFKYRKLLVARPVMPMGKDIGFLPGDIREKMLPYTQPIIDNVEYLLSGYQNGASRMMTPIEPKKKIGKSKGDIPQNDSECKEKEAGRFGSAYLELVAAGVMDIEPITFIRGRSIPQQFMIVDEAQNLTPHEIKTIITRAGEGTKIILTGDPQQIDTPYLDATNNGLTYIVERFKNEKIAGHITLTKGERSELAEIASNIL